MNTENTPDGPAHPLPEAVVDQRRRISFVWLVPIVAAVVGAWLAYTTLMEAGPTITVTFETADGLEEGKTKVKFRDVVVGQVEAIRIGDDRRHVEVTIDIAKEASGYLTETTKFWVVRARLDAAGVSGLGTIVSGAYIELEPGLSGKKATQFAGLDIPPVVRVDTPGRTFILQTESLGSIASRTPIYFRGIRVGEVLGYELAEDRRTIRAPFFIKAPYHEYVMEGSNFWDVGGIAVEAGAEGLKVKVQSLQALISGGITFDLPAHIQTSQPAAENAVFTLYPDQASIAEAAIAEKVPYVLHFEGTVRGLSVGAPVEFRGIRLGTVSAIRPVVDLERNIIRNAVYIDIEPQRLSAEGKADIIGSAEQRKRRYVMVAALVERGLRGQLQSGSLITGQQFVSLDMFPDDPKKSLDTSGPVPEIPTVPSALNEIANAAGRILGKIEKLPLDMLVADLRKAIATLDATLAESRGLVTSVRGDITPMLADFRRAAAAAKGALTQAEATMATVDDAVGDRSELRQSLSRMLAELTEAAQSIRQLSDYLERHPEALVKGKNEITGR